MRIEKDQIVSAAAVLLIVGGFVGGVYYPGVARRAAIQQRVANAKEELGINLAKNRSLKNWYENVLALRQRVNHSRGYIPRDSELASVLQGLGQSLEANGVRRQEVLTRETRDYAHYSVIPIMLGFNASFPLTYGVMKQIESMPRLMRLERLDMTSDSRDAHAPLKVNIELSTFYSDLAGSSFNTGSKAQASDNQGADQ